MVKKKIINVYYYTFYTVYIILFLSMRIFMCFGWLDFVIK